MADYQTIRPSGQTAGVGARSADIDAGLRAHMNKVYGLMSVAMLLTGGVAWAVGTNDAMASTAIFATPLKWVRDVRAAGHGVRLRRADQPPVGGRGAAVLLRLRRRRWACRSARSSRSSPAPRSRRPSLSPRSPSRALSLYGYTTKKDLSGMGTFLIMGVIGLIVASIVNIFLASSALTFAISVIGVLIFAGLTAYDTQTIKNTYLQHAQTGDRNGWASRRSWVR